MSEQPELTALQLWILRAQREILMKGELACEDRGSKSEPPATGHERIIKVSP